MERLKSIEDIESMSPGHGVIGLWDTLADELSKYMDEYAKDKSVQQKLRQLEDDFEQTKEKYLKALKEHDHVVTRFAHPKMWEHYTALKKVYRRISLGHRRKHIKEYLSEATEQFDEKRWRREIVALKRQGKSVPENDLYFLRYARNILAQDFANWGEDWEGWSENVLSTPSESVKKLFRTINKLAPVDAELHDDYWNTLDDLVNDFKYEDISERQLAPVFTPSQHQKAVLAKIITSVTDKVAGEEISRDANMVAARDVLVKLGYINYNRGRANLTPKGEQLARDEGVWDEMGQLTPQGEQHSRDGDEGEKYGPTIEAFARRTKSASILKEAFEKNLENKPQAEKPEEDKPNQTKELFDKLIHLQ